MTAAPGWYDDNTTAGIVRWFDGREWTAHTAPAPTGAAPGTVGMAPTYAGQPLEYHYASAQAPQHPAAGQSYQHPAAGQPAQYPAAAGPLYQHPAAGQPVQYNAGHPLQYNGAAQPFRAPAGSDELGPGGVLHWVVPVGRSWESIVAGYVGLIALVVWILGPVAVALGVLGVRRARSGGHGSARSVFGIVAGAIATILGAVALVRMITG